MTFYSRRNTDETLQPPGTAATLVRDDVRTECIRGQLLLEEHTFHILERPWQDNRSNISCIPAGVFEVNFLPRSASGKYREVFHLKAVPDRSGILIHAGNLASHTRGCLIIGKRRGTLAGRPAVLNSRTALEELRQVTNRQPFRLSIIGDQTC